MTYCVGLLLNEALVLAGDQRTNAGVDQIATVRKLTVFEWPGERVIALLTAGNLSITQSVLDLLGQELDGGGVEDLHAAPTMFAAARAVGSALRRVEQVDGPSLTAHGLEFAASLLVGGQIHGEPPRLFQIYTPGNFIEAGRETPYFQIGETKYGKPILDRLITFETGLCDAAKCVLLSFDSTVRSNLSVGPPIDLVVIHRDALRVGARCCFAGDDPYWNGLREGWSEGLRRTFAELPAPDWDV